MSLKPTHRQVLLAALVVFTAAGQLTKRTAAEAGWCGKCLDQTGCSCCCPACDHCCRLEAEQVDEDITCFEVESKVICIPRVVFPWQKKKCHSCDSCDGRGCTNCIHNGARTRRVCVLKTDKYTCPKCKYTWTPEPTGCCDGCDGVCDGGCAKVDVKKGNVTDTKVVTQPAASKPTVQAAATKPAWQSAAKPPSYGAPIDSGLPTVHVDEPRRWSSFNR